MKETTAEKKKNKTRETHTESHKDSHTQKNVTGIIHYYVSMFYCVTIRFESFSFPKKRLDILCYFVSINCMNTVELRYSYTIRSRWQFELRISTNCESFLSIRYNVNRNSRTVEVKKLQLYNSLIRFSLFKLCLTVANKLTHA